MTQSLKFEEAISELKNVTSVEEWNDVRSFYVNYLTPLEVHIIDISGLIVEVLGKDIIENN